MARLREVQVCQTAAPGPQAPLVDVLYEPTDEGGMRMYQTNMYEGMLAETVMMQGANGDYIQAYLARPLGPGPYPGMVLIHHLPGWDEWYREATRKFAHHGFMTISPNLYYREGHGTPEDVAAKVRAAGGVPDAQMVGDVEGSLRYLRAMPNCSGKV